MRWRLPLPSKQNFASAAAILLSALGPVFAQEMPAPPIPICDGKVNIPQGVGDRKVFLTPDEHNVIIL
jgi:hypothetical protein